MVKYQIFMLVDGCVVDNIQGLPRLIETVRPYSTVEISGRNNSFLTGRYRVRGIFYYH